VHRGYSRRVDALNFQKDEAQERKCVHSEELKSLNSFEDTNGRDHREES
jgi:hypothetical protein